MKFSYSISQRVTPRNNFIIDFCGQVRNKVILDIGCSYGWLEKAMLKKNVKKIVGLESSERSFYNAKQEVPGAEFVLGSATKLPFNDKIFDMVIYLEVMEHIQAGEEDVSIKEINRVLRKDGQLVFSTPNYHLASRLLDPAWYFGHRHYKIQQIKDLLENNGFTVLEVFLYGKFWELFRMIPHYLFKWIFQLEDPLRNFYFNKIRDDGKKEDGYAYMYIKAVKK